MYNFEEIFKNDNVKFVGGGIIFFIVGFLLSTIINKFFINKRKLTVIPVEKMKNTHGKACDFLKSMQPYKSCNHILSPVDNQTYSPFDN